jgi:glycosyltransferase involved in cell wall biosynthesis
VIPRKRQLELIKHVVGAVRRQAPDVFFCFIGGVNNDDPESAAYHTECQRTVAELGLESNVRFVGHQTSIYPWFIGSNFSVLSSTYEGLPRVMIESLACNRPVVSTAVTSAHEILQKHDCGFVVEQDNWEELTARILQLSRDTQLQKEMGSRGRAIARRLFDLETTVNQYENIYLQLARALPSSQI